MPKHEVKRRLSNILVDKGALLRLSIPFLLMIALTSLYLYIIDKRLLQALKETEIYGLQNIEVMNSLLELQRQVAILGLAGIAILAAVCFLMWVYFSHRIFGPMVPIRRHIQRLVEGNYDTRIHLRTRDEFKGLADDLNRLADTLKHNHP